MFLEPKYELRKCIYTRESFKRIEIEVLYKCWVVDSNRDDDGSIWFSSSKDRT